jgi:hypothetical protein
VLLEGCHKGTDFAENWLIRCPEIFSAVTAFRLMKNGPGFETFSLVTGKTYDIRL